MKMTVEKVFARQILDSRGKPTIEVEVTTAQGTGYLMERRI